jgi:hypothetical protein
VSDKNTFKEKTLLLYHISIHILDGRKHVYKQQPSAWRSDPEAASGTQLLLGEEISYFIRTDLFYPPWFCLPLPLQKAMVHSILDFSDLDHLASRLKSFVAKWNAHAYPFNW